MPKINGYNLTQNMDIDLDELTRSVGDLGLSRIEINKGNKKFEGYTFGSIISDNSDADSSLTPFKVSNPITTTARTAGLTSINGSIDRITFPDLVSNNELYIASSSVNDTSGGSGARSVYIQYLALAENNDNKWESGAVDITMNGQTPVVIPSSLRIIRINRMLVSSIGTSSKNEGAITISTVNNFTNGIPQVNICNAIDNGYSYSACAIYSTKSNERLFYTRGSYYTTATASKALRYSQFSTFPWNPATPNINRIEWLVGDLSVSTTAAFNVSGSASEFSFSDIEFVAQSLQAGTINSNVFWNTIRVVDSKF